MVTRTRNIVRAPRRARQWAVQPGSNGTVVAVTEAAKISFGLTAELETDLEFQLHNVTASAIRLAIGMVFQPATSIGDIAMMHFGVMWIQDDAAAAGVSSVPNPANDSADWMAHAAVTIVSESTAGHAPRFGNFLLSSDSMRKQRENHSSLRLIVSATTVPTEGVQVFVGGRVLFLLP